MKVQSFLLILSYFFSAVLKDTWCHSVWEVRLRARPSAFLSLCVRVVLERQGPHRVVDGGAHGEKALEMAEPHGLRLGERGEGPERKGFRNDSL